MFAIAGLLYGVGAVISMSSYLSATMAQTTGLELSTISVVAVGGVSLAGGGKATMIGALFGTLIIGVVDKGLGIVGVGPAYQAIATGAIIIAAVGLASLRRSSRQYAQFREAAAGQRHRSTNCCPSMTKGG